MFVLSINQIKLYNYTDLHKENPLFRKCLNSESAAYFLDETFYHTYILLFSTKISAAIVIKVTKYGMYYLIHNTYDVATKYSIISTEKCKVTCLAGSVDKNNVYFHMTCLLPKH